MGAGCGAGAGAERRSQWVHFWGWKWEQGRSPVPGRAAPSPPPHSSLFSLLPNGFFQGVPIWLTLGAVLRDPRFGRSPSRSPSPVPLCQSQQGRGSPAWKSEGGVSFPTHAALTPICLVCLIQPLCPLSVPPRVFSLVQPQPGHFTSLPCPHPMVYSVVGGFERTL